MGVEKYGDHASMVEHNPDPTTPGKERRLYRPGSLASSLGDLEAGSISLRTKSFSGSVGAGGDGASVGSRGMRHRTPSGKSIRSRRASRAEYHEDLKPDLKRGLTRNLLFGSFIIYFGSSFLFGYNIGVLNQPVELIKSFYNETYTQRMGQVDSSVITLLWSLTTALYFPGGMIGAFAAGFLADKVGRNRAIMLSQIFAFIGAGLSTACVAMRAPELLMLGRFVTGINCGFATLLVPMYIAEITPYNLRGAFGTAHQLFVTIGIFMGSVFGIKEILGTVSGWPYLLLLNAVPAVVSLIFLPFIPESPRFLMIIKGKRIAAEKALRFFRQNVDVSADIEEMDTECTTSDEADGTEAESYTMKKLLMTHELRMPLFIAVMLQVMQQFSGINAVFFYSTGIYKSAGVETYQIPYAVVITNFVNVLMTVIAVPIMDKAGRRPLLLYPMGVMVVVMGVMTMSLNLQHIAFMSYMSIMAVIVYVICFAVGLGPIPMMIGAELFRQGPRPRAMSIIGLTNWLCTTIVALSFEMIQSAMQEFTFLIFLVFMIIFTLFVYWKVPETKQKTFEEIASQFQPGGEIEVEEIVEDDVFEQVTTEASQMLKGHGGSANGSIGSCGNNQPRSAGDVHLKSGKEEKVKLTQSEENICNLPT